jgi:hypothetical protein
MAYFVNSEQLEVSQAGADFSRGDRNARADFSRGDRNARVIAATMDHSSIRVTYGIKYQRKF